MDRPYAARWQGCIWLFATLIDRRRFCAYYRNAEMVSLSISSVQETERLLSQIPADFDHEAAEEQGEGA